MSLLPPFRSSSSSNAPLSSVPLLDVGRENAQLEPEILAAIKYVVQSGRFVLGPEVQQLEQRIAKLCQASEAVGCASGSDALLLALMAIGIEAGDEVILPSFTFFATASAVTRLGGVPIFVDIEPSTYNIAPQAVKMALTNKTKAVIPVHLFGQPANVSAIREVVGDEIAIIEDAAQAIGASEQNRPVGSIGDIGCFSFYPTKNLGGFGDGGMLTTNSEQLADRLRLLRGHGMNPRYYHSEVGINSRLDTLQAVVLNIKLPYLKAWSQTRAKNARRYDQLFQKAGVTDAIQLPLHPEQAQHVWNQYTVRVAHGSHGSHGGRDALRQHLAQNGVGAEIYYPVPLHQQECFTSIEKRFALPETERAAKEVLSLPIFPFMTPAEQETVVFRVTEFVESQRADTVRRVA